jgi:acyl-CoA synthetase (NDP forming)
MSGHRATQADAAVLAGIRARAQAMLGSASDSSAADSSASNSSASDSSAADGNHGVALNEGQCRPLLAGAVPFGRATAVAGVTEARAAAQATGYPVVCKLLDPAVVHKTELGLVRRGIADDGELAKAAAELLERGRELQLSNPVLSVQRQLSGIEMAVGVFRDELGPVVMVATGGTLVELLDDAAREMAPVSPQTARAMIAGLRGASLLEGYRGGEALDVGALAELIATVSELAVAVPEIAELDLNPVFVSEAGVLAADARCSLRPLPAPARADLYAGLPGFVSPRRIALVGGSSARLKVGGLVARYLRKHGFDGDLVVVNPNGTEVDGARNAAAVGEITEPVDLACIAVPRSAVAQAIADCVAAGIPNGIIYSAGFAESGEAGRKAQQELVELAGGRFRFVGPNSMGVAALHRNFLATFGMAMEADSFQRGPVAFISQSGSIASALFSRADELGVGFSHWISVGNEGDLSIEDFIAYAADDPACRVICLFVEVIRRPEAFAAAAARARAAGKPVVAYKTGWTDAGRASTASHTGAMASADAVYSAFFRRHGIVRVADLSDLFPVATALDAVGGAAGQRIGIVSMSGGACSILVDSCESLGLEVPAFGGELRAALNELLPAYATSRNPVDVTATGIQEPELVTESVKLVLGSGAVDLVLVQLGTNADPSAAVMATMLAEIRAASPVPFLVSRLGSPHLAPAAVEIYAAAGIPVFSWPGQLAAAAAASVTFGTVLRHKPAGEYGAMRPLRSARFVWS